MEERRGDDEGQAPSPPHLSLRRPESSGVHSPTYLSWFDTAAHSKAPGLVLRCLLFSFRSSFSSQCSCLRFNSSFETFWTGVWYHLTGVPILSCEPALTWPHKQCKSQVWTFSSRLKLLQTSSLVAKDHEAIMKEAFLPIMLPLT